MDDSEKHYAIFQKPDAKHHILYHFVYTKCAEKENL